MLISEIMNRNVATLTPDDQIIDAIDVMKSKNIGSIIITDENNNPINIVTIRDILQSINCESSEYKNIKLDKLEQKLLITIDEDKPLKVAIQMLFDFDIHHIIVIDSKGKLAGILTTKDIVINQHKLNMAYPNFLNLLWNNMIN